MPWPLRPRGLLAIATLATAGYAWWAMSRPNLISCPYNANESAAIATLKCLHQAQRQFVALAAIDRDGDGRGEAGFFEELAGAQPLRCGEASTRRYLEPRLMSEAFGEVDAGLVRRSGYGFRMYLPAARGRWVGTRERAELVQPDASEAQFCIYAWPLEAGSGRRVFFTDAGGDIFANTNDGWRYRGRSGEVPVDAAMPSSDTGCDQYEPGVRLGRDGQPWYLVQ